MNPRFSLALVALVLVAGAVALWQSSGQQSAVPQSYTLAISWHPAFCETKPGLRECRDERSSDYAAENFSLHGLWPEPEYCGVSDGLIAVDGDNRWSDLPEVDVSENTWRDLQRIMPGTRAQLERHEWIVHGTCSGASADRYFSRAIEFVETINTSAVQDLMARNLGKHVSRNQIRAAFDAAFGDGAGSKVRVDCEADGDRDLIVELRVNLEGSTVEGRTPMGRGALSELIHAARNASAGCTGGTVDRVGEQ